MTYKLDFETLLLGGREGGRERGGARASPIKPVTSCPDIW